MTSRSNNKLVGPFRVLFPTPDGQMEVIGRARLGPVTNPREDPDGLEVVVYLPNHPATDALWNLYENSIIRGFVVDAPAATSQEPEEKKPEDVGNEPLVYDLRPPRVHAVQWFKNGDHPKDHDVRMESHYVWYHIPPENGNLHDICPNCGNSWHAHGYLASSDELKVRSKIRSAAIQGMDLTAELPPRDPSRVVCPGDFLIRDGGSLVLAQFDRVQHPYEFHSEYIFNPDPQRK